ncbi:MAG TPA: hypothetical protein VNQ90_10755 [Chthoniobacteraceae bacterium]|nr:hypothetical protein [Chthoniobacteraceae bacterium]
MKKIKKARTHLAAIVLGLAVFLCATPSRADYQTSFDVPPYTLNSTIVGVEGWTEGAGSAVSTGIVTTAPWDAETTVYRLNLGDGGNVVRVKNSGFTPLTGKVALTVTMAFDFGTQDKTTLSSFAFTDGIAGPISFGFFHQSDANGGGLYYQGADNERVTILAKSQMAKNAIYEFTLTIDIAAKLFDISVSGIKTDEQPFSFSAASLSSGTFKNGNLNLIYLSNGGNASFTTYVDQIDLRAIPEPGAVALVLSAGAGFLLLSSRKSNRQGSL